jgi:hypothetical protein
MKYFLLVVLIAISHSFSFSQTNRIIRAKAGEDVAQAYSPNGFYRFPAFAPATVYFKGGTSNKGPLLNYNIISGNLQFVSPKGDTLDMANNNTIDSVVFEKNVFDYNDGFMEMITRSDSLVFFKKINLKTQVENVGAYGLSNTTASITNIKTFTSGTSVYNLVLNQDVIITETTSWFVIKGNGNPVKLNKDNFLKLLPVDKQAKAAAYLKQNKASLEKEEELKKMIATIAG